MKKLLIAAMLSMAFVGGAAQAAEEEGKQLSGQQLRMKNCNAEAKTKELKGDERKAFMKECLSGGKSEKVAAAEKPAAKAPAEKAAEHPAEKK